MCHYILRTINECASDRLGVGCSSYFAEIAGSVVLLYPRLGVGRYSDIYRVFLNLIQELLNLIQNLIQNTSKQQNAHSLTTPALRKLLKKRVEFWIASAAD
jgi:hypothetical protein